MAPDLRYRLITDPRDPAIWAFGRLQEASFPEPDLLIPPSAFPRMIASRSGARRNFLLVAEAEGALIGGAIFHYLPEPGSAFSSFLAVDRAHRGQGVARGLHEARFRALDEAAGEQGSVPGVFIDVVAPERLSRAELDRERAVGADPVERRRVFQRLGFRKVDVAYCQPPDEAGGSPITNMDLLFCPRSPAERVETELVVGTMRAYWRPWLGERAAQISAAELERRCGGPNVALLDADQP